jgi:hypothetical protein
MNEFDQFVKHVLKVKRYARYTDDFIIVSTNREYLVSLLKPIENFLGTRLQLTLHPHKVEIRKYTQGIDFLGYVMLPHHIKLRTKTKNRMMRNVKTRVREYKKTEISEGTLAGVMRSYSGVLSHADAHALTEEVWNMYWFLLSA